MNGVTIRITVPLRKFTSGLDDISLEHTSVGDVLSILGINYLHFQGRSFDTNGDAREFVLMSFLQMRVNFSHRLKTHFLIESESERSICPCSRHA